MRYVLALLLVRRRVLRVDLANGELGEPQGDEANNGKAETLVVYCPKRELTYEVLVAMPDGERIDQIQQQLSELLIADAE